MARLSLRRCRGLAVIVWLAAAGGCVAPDPPALTGTFVLAEGEVSIRRPGIDKWEPAKLPQKLYDGDAVRTGPDSRAAILGVDESQIKLNENTILLMKSSLQAPGGIAGEIIGLEGKVTVNDKPTGLNQKLHAGDEVRTSPDSRADIICGNGSRFLVSGGTTFKISGTRRDSAYTLPQGEIYRRKKGEKWGPETDKIINPFVLCAKLTSIHGQVTVCKSGSDHWEPAKLNQDLQVGDLVRAGPASRATITLYPDEKQIQLDESETLVMRPRAPRSDAGLIDASGDIDWLDGEVTVNKKPATLGQLLYAGDVVRTGPASRATLWIFGPKFAGITPMTPLDESSLIYLEENSEKVIRERPSRQELRG